MDFTELFLDGIKENERYQEALSLVQQNSSGRIWIIGGTVFRTIAKKAYMLGVTNTDFDFVLESPLLIDENHVPSGWNMQRNAFGNPKLLKGDISIDYIPLAAIGSPGKKLPPSIETVLATTPLDIQSIAFDVQQQRVLGTLGANAILSKIVAVNDVAALRNYCMLKKVDPAEYLKEKARSLYFYPELSGLE